MKKYTYYCDGGSLKLGNGNFTATYGNDFGDGDFEVRIYDSEEEVMKDYELNQLNFKGSVEGEISIYEYDCGNEILTTINGRYGIYAHCGDIILEKWKKWN